MSFEDNIVLTAATFGSVYLCINSLKEINNTKCCYKSLPFYCNYFIFGVSTGVFMSIIKHKLKE